MKDLKVKNYLFQAIDRTILEQILEKRTAKQIWDSMKKKFEGNARVKRSILQALRRDFEVLEMKVGETITEYFTRVMAIANKMRSNGENMKEVTIVEKILRTLTEKFNYVVVSIEESKDIDTLSVDELQSSLVVHEQKFIKPNREEQALKVSSENSFGTRGRGRGRGHYQNECPLWDKEVNYAEFDEEEEILLMSYDDLPQNNSEQEEAWFLDSGCSNHMCGDKSKFSEMDEIFRHSVKLGNNTKMNVLGKGNVKLSINGVTHVIQDVFYVPELKNNLLSIGQL
uniref:Retrovirus-related Pol polyprotein from transposon TNT 1-94 n=1 Tax=Cajanus cajan TaxID=3821 RepID=A0A151THS4_CAJCA|nr:Retrovirus-related Pol polyprotein from transposon TNT 1-94 [Cajanus cajan]